MSVSNSLLTEIEVEKKDAQIWINGTQLLTSRTFSTLTFYSVIPLWHL